MPAKHREEGDGAWLSIGALSRATGIAVETLRTWESRYGFPVPERKPSGHRVYPVSAVPRLRRIAQALTPRPSRRTGRRRLGRGARPAARGERPGRSPAPAAAAPPAGARTSPALLRLVKSFDGERLTRLFLADWARMGPVEFLEARLAPLVRAVGEGWEQNDLEIRHEHFLSERVGDLLRSLRMPLEERATGPARRLRDAARRGPRPRSADVGPRPGRRGLPRPVPRDGGADPADRRRSPGTSPRGRWRISVSSATKGAANATAMRKLREALPRRVLLVAGGDGAPASRPGVE